MNESCDLCGKHVDISSLQTRELSTDKTLFLCIACDGYYTDEDLLDKISNQ